MRARDVMTTPVVTVGPETDIHDVARLLLENRISAMPVTDADQRILGIVSEGDLMRRPENETERHPSWWLAFWTPANERAAAYLKGHGQTAREVMTRNVVTVTEDTPLGEIAELLEARRIKRVPVVRDERLVGIVSRANLLHGLAAATKPAAPANDDDRSIRARVLDALKSDLGIAGGLVNVIVRDGVVDLWAQAESDAERRAMIVAAENAAAGHELRTHVFVPSATIRALDWGI
jgi:CBS domain-containing protein